MSNSFQSVLLFIFLFPLLSSRFIREDTEEPLKVFQKSYPLAMWGNPVNSTEADIAYGYILFNYKDLSPTDPELLKAIKQVWGKICGKEKTLKGDKLKYPWSKMKVDNIRIKFARSQELRYTVDGYTQAVSRSFKTGELEPVVMGMKYMVQFTAPDNINVLLDHNVTISSDREGNFYLFHHSYVPSSQNQQYQGMMHFSSEMSRLSRHTSIYRHLRVLSYNAWNTMPALWYISGKPRFTWYYSRMQLMSRYILDADPDVVVLQEIRYDETLGDKEFRFQLSHLAQLLPGYQYVYQPANMYVERHARVEEGVAIFSKFPITRQDYIILSRDFRDKQDDHQRVVLHATIAVPFIGNVQVYGTHLSLSETARDRTVVELSDFIDKNGKSGFSVFCGDLNAEPQSRAMKYLIGQGDLEGKRTDYRDAFLGVHPEPVPRSPTAGARLKGLTFPTDNPVKRIDYIIYKQGAGVRVDVEDSQLVGLKPVPGTESDDLRAGMMSEKSAIWASDHRGVFADFVFQ